MKQVILLVWTLFSLGSHAWGQSSHYHCAEAWTRPAEVYDQLDTMPAYAGGSQKKLQKYIRKHLDLSGLEPLAKESHKAFALLTIDPKGHTVHSCVISVGDPKVVEAYNLRALAATEGLAFSPGYKNGKAVYAQVKIPIVIESREIKRQNKRR